MEFASAIIGFGELLPWVQSGRKNVDTEFIQLKIPSNILKKSLNGDFYRLGNAEQRLDGNDFFTAFDFAEVFRI